jgi:uncharacterized phiE125 gp8 family phage protein
MSNLCVLADVKTFLGITDTNSDAVLSALIPNVSATIESFCNRVFASSAYTDTFNGNGGTKLFLRNGPVVSVSSVTCDGVAIVTAPSAIGAGYMADDAQVYLRGLCFPRGVQNVAVSYVAGYAVIPPDVVQVCIEMVASHYAKRNRIDKASETLGTQQTISYSMADMPASAKSALQQRVWWCA